jgi:hypothetical protein
MRRRRYSFGFRAADERYDLMRTARDQRYVYVRNYNPLGLRPVHRHMWATPFLWDRLQGETAQTRLGDQAARELYDLRATATK